MTKKEQRQAVYNKYDGHCAYCGVKLKRNSFEVDHFTPILRGWKNYDVDHFENLMPACRPCNHGKKCYKIEQWREVIQGKIKELNRDSGVYRAALRFGLVTESNKPIRFHFENVGSQNTLSR